MGCAVAEERGLAGLKVVIGGIRNTWYLSKGWKDVKGQTVQVSEGGRFCLFLERQCKDSAAGVCLMCSRKRTEYVAEVTWLVEFSAY